jgi:hypothetical protein
MPSDAIDAISLQRLQSASAVHHNLQLPLAHAFIRRVILISPKGILTRSHSEAEMTAFTIATLLPAWRSREWAWSCDGGAARVSSAPRAAASSGSSLAPAPAAPVAEAGGEEADVGELARA